VWDGTSDSCKDDPCDPDPCGIDNAVADTCTFFGADDFTCTCESGFFWKDEGNTCEDPCDPDPCEGIQDATRDTCTAVAWDDFTCDCDEGFEWNDGTNTCAEVVDPCTPDPCQGISNAVADSCVDLGGGGFSCDCNEGFLWNLDTDTCDEVPADPCDPDPCQGISDADADTCVPGEGDDFTCECDQGFTWDDGSNTCVEEGVLPAFAGGTYETRATGLQQDPQGCLIPQGLLGPITLFMGNVPAIYLTFPAGAQILDFQEAANPYELPIQLPVFGFIEVALTLNDTYDTILMDGPDSYAADISGILPAWMRLNCVITGSADGEFTDINTEPLTGSLTIGVTDVQASPAGLCNLSLTTQPCDITVTLDAGSPF
jgi:hypothetical protein